MMTGCHPQTNGIQGFLTARPGQPLDCRVPGVFADRLKAEPIWQTALLNGRRSYVVKFPVSYPSQASLRVDGAAGWGGITCLHETAVAGTSRWPGTGQIGEGPAWAGAAPGGGAVAFLAASRYQTFGGIERSNSHWQSSIGILILFWRSPPHRTGPGYVRRSRLVNGASQSCCRSRDERVTRTTRCASSS